jgi:hypothetical protein
MDAGLPLAGCPLITLVGGSNIKTVACNTTALSVGSHSAVAQYSGDTNNSAASSNLITQIVTKLPSTTTLTSSPNPAALEENIALVAAVVGWRPSGRVSFSVDGVPIPNCSSVFIGNFTFGSNTAFANCGTGAIPAGYHEIIAAYGGDENNSSSSAPPIPEFIATSPGQASFENYDNLPVGSMPEAVVIADLDGDGRNDVIMTTSGYVDPQYDFMIFIYYQKADGTLDVPVRLPAGNGRSIGIGDLNGDGIPDIVTTFDDGIGVYYGQGNRQFATLVHYPGLHSSYQLQIADLNNDGRQDVVAIDFISDSMDVYYQNATGNLNSPIIQPAIHLGFDDMKVGDLNGDGLTDVVISAAEGSSDKVITIILQQLDGALAPPVYLPAIVDALGDSLWPSSVAIIDVNDDGLNDLLAFTTQGFYLYANLGGSFASPIPYLSSTSASASWVADVNLDGLADLVVVYPGHLGVLTRKADGGFNSEQFFQTSYLTSFNPQQLAIGDLDRDGKPDVAISGLTVLYNATPAIASNFALAGNGGVASASTTMSAAFPASSINDDERAGAKWGDSGGWNDATANTFPDWVQIKFSGKKTIDRVIVYTLQDDFLNPVEPSDSLTFTQWGLTDFNVQSWNGSAWVTLTTITNNNLVKRTVSFSAVATDRIRVNITHALGAYSRITEVEAWGVTSGLHPTTTLASSLNPSPLNAGLSFTAVVTASEPTGTVNFTDSAISINGCAAVPLSGTGDIRSATCNTSQLNLGYHGIVATFEGDPSNPPSSSATLLELVIPGGGPSNVALASNGGVATASSTISPAFPASSINNGERAGVNWGNGGGWNDASANAYPDWVQIAFNGGKTIDRVVVYTVQDNYANPVEPTDAQTFSLYGVTAFNVQGKQGRKWVTLATVTGNNLVKRTVTFAPFTTDHIRINVTKALASYSRITEVEAWSN